MSFNQSYHLELQRLRPFFLAASTADKEFHRALKENCSRLGLTGYKKTDLYDQTLNRFRQSCRVIDEIISMAFLQAKLGDLTQLPTLFAYLAFPERYYGSGYQRASIWRFMKKFPLDEEQCRILCAIVLNQIAAAGPEFIEISRTARKVNSADFRESIKSIGLQSQKEFISKRIKRLLSLLEFDRTGR